MTHQEEPRAASQARPVMPTHDRWLHDEEMARWVRLLGEQGRVAVAPGRPGEQQSVSETWEHVRSCRRPPVIGPVHLMDHFAAVARLFRRPR
ncbi:hypothetical protein [Streptosporangium lutulentum]|uniref:Uncharacterized protein n=1 Tax=Streptosporangium lutulentum TaxID=1461250 RepID=A0ABT9Q2N0_9ACTN|nr:hypothetical protein [Streptosporangium lutulentum]MDP9840986.1 hypothetical protein [Streptosporangium lutulentum]